KSRRQHRCQAKYKNSRNKAHILLPIRFQAIANVSTAARYGYQIEPSVMTRFRTADRGLREWRCHRSHIGSPKVKLAAIKLRVRKRFQYHHEACTVVKIFSANLHIMVKK